MMNAVERLDKQIASETDPIRLSTLYLWLSAELRERGDIARADMAFKCAQHFIGKSVHEEKSMAALEWCVEHGKRS